MSGVQVPYKHRTQYGTRTVAIQYLYLYAIEYMYRYEYLTCIEAEYFPVMTRAAGARAGARAAVAEPPSRTFLASIDEMALLSPLLIALRISDGRP